ncbi:MAG: GNAT family N-acetyltransferase [Hoeflea sp.]|uniref:GNAT family N-acetyltransferase n=1 Tax=Hoeflea sp. TaxID=1940281 RepID=UPI0032EC00BF
MTIEITVSHDEDGDYEDVVEGIVDGAAAKLGVPFDPKRLYLRALDADGHLVGGLTAHTVQGWLFVKLLGVKEGQRGTGTGRKLLARAEAFARSEGMVGVYLDTFEFQAPRFYESLGYSEFGRLPAAGGKPQRIWLARILDAKEEA